MQFIFNLTRGNFKQAIKLGDIFEHANNRYVITHILKIKRVFPNGGFIAKVIAQQVGTKSKHDKYESVGIFESKYLRMEITPQKPLYKKGDTFSSNGICQSVIGIKSIKHEFVDLIVEYLIEFVEPWNDKQMNEAVKKNRLATFKVIEGNG